MISREGIEQAAQRIHDHVRRTPVMSLTRFTWRIDVQLI